MTTSLEGTDTLLLFDRIEQFVEQQGLSAYKREEFDFNIFAQGDKGFSVCVTDDRPPTGWVLRFGDCGAGYLTRDPNKVMELVAIALSSEARLRVTGERLYVRSTLERRVGTDWQPIFVGRDFSLSCLFRNRPERFFNNR